MSAAPASGLQPPAIMCNLSDTELEALFIANKVDGKLPKRKLVRVLRDKMGDGLKGAKDPAAMRQFLKDMDEDGDGKYDFEEFKNAMAKVKC